MSTINIININNKSTNKASTEMMTGLGLDLIKNIRFNVGCIDIENIKLALELRELSCEDYCKIDAEDRVTVREEILKTYILKLKELD